MEDKKTEYFTFNLQTQEDSRNCVRVIHQKNINCSKIYGKNEHKIWALKLKDINETRIELLMT